MFIITGREQDGRIVATEQTNSAITAYRISTSWREAGLDVEVVEQ